MNKHINTTFVSKQLDCIVCFELTAHIWCFLQQRLSVLTQSSSLAAAQMSRCLIGADTHTDKGQTSKEQSDTCRRRG